MDLGQIWVGVGIKGGGFLGALGATSLNGFAWRCDAQPLASLISFTVTEFQIGLGLGGGVNVGIFYAFDTPLLYSLNGNWGNWGGTMNVSLPDGNVSSAFEPLKDLSALSPAFISNLNQATLGTLVNWVTAIYQGLQAAGSTGPSLSGQWGTFDLPAGSGVEVMAGVSKSQLFVGS